MTLYCVVRFAAAVLLDLVAPSLVAIAIRQDRTNEAIREDVRQLDCRIRQLRKGTS